MLVNAGELAARLGITKGRISQLKKAGVLHPTKGGKYASEESEKQYLAFLSARGATARADSGETDVARERAALRLELERTRLEREQAAAELAKLKQQIVRGELVNWKAARLLLSRVIWNLRTQIWNLPLKFIHLLTEKESQQIDLDVRIKDWFETAFELTNEKDIARENAVFLQRCDILIKLCEADLVILQHEKRDTDTVQICLEFIRDVRGLFLEMRPELIARLGLKIHTMREIAREAAIPSPNSGVVQ